MKPDFDWAFFKQLLIIDIANIPALMSIYQGFDQWLTVWVSSDGSLPTMLHEWLVVGFDFLKIIYIVFIIILNFYGGWKLMFSKVVDFLKKKKDGVDNK